MLRILGRWRRFRHFIWRLIIIIFLISFTTTCILYQLMTENIDNVSLDINIKNNNENVKNDESTCILSMEAQQAINRAKSQYCKSVLNNISCQITSTENFFPDKLPRYCPCKDSINGELIGCLLSNINDPIEIYNTSAVLTSTTMCIDYCLKYSMPYAGYDLKNRCTCFSSFNKTILSHPNITCQHYVNKKRQSYIKFRRLITIYRTGYKECLNRLERKKAKKDANTVTIVFFLTIGGRHLRQIKRFIRIIYSKNHYYLIHVDSREYYIYRELTYLTQSYSNIKLQYNRYPTTWGSSTLLDAHLDAFRQLFNDLKWSWNFIINLSETDFPLKPLNVLTTFLSMYPEYNFLRSHNRDPLNFTRSQGLLHTFVQCEDYMYRIGPRELIKDIVYDGGSDWYCLNRDFIHYIINENDNLLNGLLNTFHYSLLPCEVFFHTLLINSIYCGSFVRNNLRLVNWNRDRGCKCQHKNVVDWCGCSPLVYRIEDKTILSNTFAKPLFFARKFDPIVDEEIIDWLDQQVSGRNLTGASLYLHNMFHILDEQSTTDYLINALKHYISLMIIHHHSICPDAISYSSLEIQQIHATFVLSKFQGYAIHYMLNDNEFELFLQASNNFDFKSSEVRRFEVGTIFDNKELIFRDYGKTFIEPKTIKVLIDCERTSRLCTNGTLIISNPYHTILQRIKIFSLTYPIIIDIVFQNQSDTNGIWSMSILSNVNEMKLAVINFLILSVPLTENNINSSKNDFMKFWSIKDFCYIKSNIFCEFNITTRTNCTLKNWSFMYTDIKSDWTDDDSIPSSLNQKVKNERKNSTIYIPKRYSEICSSKDHNHKHYKPNILAARLSRKEIEKCVTISNSQDHHVVNRKNHKLKKSSLPNVGRRLSAIKNDGCAKQQRVSIENRNINDFVKSTSTNELDYDNNNRTVPRHYSCKRFSADAEALGKRMELAIGQEMLHSFKNSLSLERNFHYNGRKSDIKPKITKQQDSDIIQRANNFLVMNRSKSFNFPTSTATMEQHIIPRINHKTNLYGLTEISKETNSSEPSPDYDETDNNNIGIQTVDCEQEVEPLPDYETDENISNVCKQQTCMSIDEVDEFEQTHSPNRLISDDSSVMPNTSHPFKSSTSSFDNDSYHESLQTILQRKESELLEKVPEPPLSSTKYCQTSTPPIAPPFPETLVSSTSNINVRCRTIADTIMSSRLLLKEKKSLSPKHSNIPEVTSNTAEDNKKEIMITHENEHGRSYLSTSTSSSKHPSFSTTKTNSCSQLNSIISNNNCYFRISKEILEQTTLRKVTPSTSKPYSSYGSVSQLNLQNETVSTSLRRITKTSNDDDGDDDDDEKDEENSCPTNSKYDYDYDQQSSKVYSEYKKRTSLLIPSRIVHPLHSRTSFSSIMSMDHQNGRTTNSFEKRGPPVAVINQLNEHFSSRFKQPHFSSVSTTSVCYDQPPPYGRVNTPQPVYAEANERDSALLSKNDILDECGLILPPPPPPLPAGGFRPVTIQSSRNSHQSNYSQRTSVMTLPHEHVPSENGTFTSSTSTSSKLSDTRILKEIITNPLFIKAKQELERPSSRILTKGKQFPSKANSSSMIALSGTDVYVNHVERPVPPSVSSTTKTKQISEAESITLDITDLNSALTLNLPTKRSKSVRIADTQPSVNMTSNCDLKSNSCERMPITHRSQTFKLPVAVQKTKITNKTSFNGKCLSRHTCSNSLVETTRTSELETIFQISATMRL
ncbi:unnamed protein product [Didymodactylos carnosus]|uniref:protein xylosyltransferase n=1 Tax=Didymodactylos carnosus TaxID=1234261 RepID=A0A814F100_9BILA|nr:unnamed protein product [Didymodactylos carnosus]CAF0974494.1 unnamed protein product [Didymodactylos carnosus]CAF3613158.1 unnamed protein product [Didymodactylos carnosus]CAF3747385.1 unnamed protein product [Didymodactylos carnosus]